MNSFLQLNTIFISILIEAIPFVLIGVFIAGFIQMFVSEEMVAKVVPKNRFLAVLYGALVGAIFPACECGIVPIVRRLLLKGVPLHTAIAFMLTGPIINPVVLFSTFIAFGNQWDMVWYRGGLALIIALIIGILISIHFKGNELLKQAAHPHCHHPSAQTFMQKLVGMLRHAVDEFFSVGKYLIIGAFIAAAMQTYLKTSTLLEIGQTDQSSSLVMMGLAFVLSLCSEADAFIASSFRGTFSTGALVAFLVYGPMVDIKNMLMMLSVFNKRFVAILIGYITLFVFIGSLLI
ncbi:permease [Bacillus massiliigorillae]|uniref:permease n=1 Tax=Bacillus massiliigorillae TaxID=1243664 RepID=UPI0003A5837B|nr:permease [Bacillus massiliigorillae]